MSSAPGWYDDGSGRQRWWDGTAWTDHYAPAPPETPAPVAETQWADLSDAPQKPGPKKALVIAGIVVAALVLISIVGAIGSRAGSEASKPTATASPVSAMVTVPNVIGLTGDVARDALTAAGFVVKFDGGEDAVVLASNWTVGAQSPNAGAGAEEGSTITLTVSKPAPAAPEADVTTSQGLESTYARSACDIYGDAQYPYGFKAHWLVGNLGETLQDDQWFLKVTATVKNEYNAKRDVVIECYVSGTNDAPQVTDFLAY